MPATVGQTGCPVLRTRCQVHWVTRMLAG